MPGFIAKKLCPNLVIVPTNFDKYRAVSGEVSGMGKHINSFHLKRIEDTPFCILIDMNCFLIDP